MKFIIHFKILIFLLSLSLQDVKAETQFPPTRILQFSRVDLNFAFDVERQDFFYDEETWFQFWKEHSRIIPAPQPQTKINWNKEVILMLAWPGEFDSRDKLASLLSTKIDQVDEETKRLSITGVLTSPCVANMTDRSPILFLSFNQEDLLFNDFELKVIETEEVGCDNNPLPRFGK